MLHEQLEESFVQTVIALANAIDARDSYTSDHSERLIILATETAKLLNCNQDEILALNWAVRLHDIGKIGVPDEILQKPGPLSDEEWKLMQQHPEIGADIIAPVARLKDVAPLIRAHHERYDGTGYPNNLQKERIPLGARILSLVDSYGAITDNRVYRAARSHQEAIAEINNCIGTQFDPKVASIFLNVVDEFYQNESGQLAKA
jgi:HD-GYP domain-containing protein (c-di-GMP phosphodiesterase class II)